MNDLSIDPLTGARLPDYLVLDTNVVVARMLRPSRHPSSIRQAQQAKTLLDELQSAGKFGLLTPTGFAEVLHLSIRNRYQRELRERRAELDQQWSRRISSWTELYKRDSSIIRRHSMELERLRANLAIINVVIASPNDLAPFPATQPFDRELIRMVGRYGLDTSDCLILMEAERLGVRSIVTMDRDLLRASEDFDILTWD